MPKDLRLDLTRAIAIIMVAIVHSMGLINSATETKSILLTKGFYSITQTGVPLFVMLSGALLLGNRFYCENILFIGYFLAGYFLYSTPITLVQKIFKYSFFM